MKNPRLIYRVALKILGLSAFALLLWVMTRSLFVGSNAVTPQQASKENKASLVSLAISGMQKGEVRKLNWQGKEVAVLYRKVPISFHTKYIAKLPHPSLNSGSRSIKPEYFVYINKGDSGNCPLFYSNDTFKDICSSTLFNSAGREKANLQQGYKIQIPPHHFKNDHLIIGEWPKAVLD